MSRVPRAWDVLKDTAFLVGIALAAIYLWWMAYSLGPPPK